MLPPSRLETDPTFEQLQMASANHMEYKKIFVNGVFQYWKLYHKKTPRPCNCGGGKL